MAQTLTSAIIIQQTTQSKDLPSESDIFPVTKIFLHFYFLQNPKFHYRPPLHPILSQKNLALVLIQSITN
jgi:hypothetical protein